MGQRKYSEALKRKMVAFAERTSNTAAERRFGISESCVRRWRKLKNQSSDVKQISQTKKAKSEGRNIALEEMLNDFVQTRLSCRVPVTASEIQAKANEISDRMGGCTIHSRQWVEEFISRWGIPSHRPGKSLLDGMTTDADLKSVRSKQSGKKKRELVEVKVDMESEELPAGRRGRETRRTIKKPKMDQFVTFSDCSDLEEEVGREQPDFEFSDNDSSYRGENDDKDSLDSQPIQASWSKQRVPDEVAIQELNPGVQVFMEIDDNMNFKEESCEQIAEDGEGFSLGSANQSGASLKSKLSCIKRSPVWRHFTRHPLVNEIAVCNYCSAELRVSRGSTTSLAKHIMKHLRSKVALTMGEGHSSLGETSDGDASFPSDPFPIQVSAVQSLRSSPALAKRQMKDVGVSVSLDSEPPEGSQLKRERCKLITEKVALMMIKDYQPVSLVLNPGFRDVVFVMEPKYQIPKASHFSDVVIPDLHRKMLKKRKEEYSTVLHDSKWCSLTVDRWTSAVGGSVHLGITCHNISEAFEISRQFLASKRLTGKQSGQDLHRVIASTLEDWGFNTSEMQLFVVTESARELQAAANSGKCPWVAIQCFGHSLELVVRGAMDSTSSYAELLRKVGDINHRYYTMPEARKGLLDIVWKKSGGRSSGDEDMCLEDWESVDGSSSNWVTEHRMIERIVKHKEAIKTELESRSEGSKVVLDLEEDEWELAEAVVEVLKPIEEAMKDFCSSTYPPLSMTIPIIFGMEHMLSKVLQEASPAPGTASSPSVASPSSKHSSPPPPTPVLRSALFARNLLRAMRSRFPSYKTNRTSLLAMVLDPRYKAVILTEQEVNLVTKMLVDEIVDTPSSSLPKSSPSKYSPASEKGSRRGAVEDSGSKRASRSSGVTSLLWSAFEEVSREQPAGAGRKLALYQVKQYMDEPVLSRDCDPFLWWMENREKYNLIFPVARKYASIPATQVKGSALIGDPSVMDTDNRRLFLPESQVESLVFLHENY